MLTADEYYTAYMSVDRRALQLSKYYLTKWGEIERNASLLDEGDKENAYILFSTLNEMTEAERKFLADKFRVEIYGKSSRSDKDMAEEYNMTFKEYRHLRKGVEYKFYHYLKPLLIEYRKSIAFD